MPTIPRIRLSDRKLGINPTLHYTVPDYAGLGRAWGDAAKQIGNGLDRFGNALVHFGTKGMDSRDQREADDLFTRYLQGGRETINGAMEYDENGQPTGKRKEGIVDRKYDPDNKDVSPVTDFTEFEKTFFSDDRYVNASQRVKDLFKSRVIRSNAQQGFFDTVNKIDNTNRLEWAKIAKQRADGEADLRVSSCAFGDDEEFGSASESASRAKAVRNLGSWVKNPEYVYDAEFDEDKLEFASDKAKAEYYRQKSIFEKDYATKRVSEMVKAAKNGTSVNGLSPEQILEKAEVIINGYDGEEMLFDDGNGGPARKERVRSIDFTDAEIAAFRGDLAKAKEGLGAFRERQQTAMNKAEYDKYSLEVQQVLNDYNDPRADPLSAKLDLDAFESRIFDNPILTDKQKEDLVGDYQRIVGYQKKYAADLKAHQEAVAAKRQGAIDKDRSEHGFYREDGVFIPASSFVQKSDAIMARRFDEKNPCWQDPRTALIKLEAARCTGRLDEGDYKKYRAYGEMLLDEKAQAAWLKLYPKIDFSNLQRIYYGEDISDLPGKTRKQIEAARTRGGESSPTALAATGIYAKTAGTRSKAKDMVEMLNDSLNHDDSEKDTEELIPPDVLAEVYGTVRRLARCGVDPEEAVRQIIAPTLDRGVEMSILQRVRSPDYFRTLVDKSMTEQGAAADYERAKKANLAEQGRPQPQKK